MSQISKAIFGALAISVACGAVQLAFGHDLSGIGQAASAASETGVNRAAKADRDAVKWPPAQTRTFALRLTGMPDTSVLVRMPAAAKESVKESVKQDIKEEARNRPAPSMMKPNDRKNAVACEPVVSVLTEVAKLLQPGRCVT
ncbi:MAG: hypothetical protein ABJA75_21930 [Bradyrhizobium sp.]